MKTPLVSFAWDEISKLLRTCCVLECDIAFSEVKLGDDTCSFEFSVELCLEIM